VRVDRYAFVIGGTSAVAPYGRLIARLNQISGKSAGLINPQLYQAPAVFRDITSGNIRRLHGRYGLGCLHGIGSPRRPRCVALSEVEGPPVRNNPKSPTKIRYRAMM